MGSQEKSRSYSSPVRDDQARRTRERILDSGRRLFIDRGYAGTTIADVAASAKVSVQTVYNVIGGKAELLKVVYDSTLSGDDEPGAMMDRPVFSSVTAAPDALSSLAAYARFAGDINRRVHPLLRVLLTGGVSASDEIRAFVDTIESQRASGTKTVATHVQTAYGLREGVTLGDASSVLWALTSHDLADRLAVRREWGWDKFEDWLGVAMAAAIA